jgi:DNA repair ATPase RecN
MDALDRNSSLYRRYLAELEQQENELDELETRLEDRNQARRALQEELDRVIGGL